MLKICMGDRAGSFPELWRNQKMHATLIIIIQIIRLTTNLLLHRFSYPTCPPQAISDIYVGLVTMMEMYLMWV